MPFSLGLVFLGLCFVSLFVCFAVLLPQLKACLRGVAPTPLVPADPARAVTAGPSHTAVPLPVARRGQTPDRWQVTLRRSRRIAAESLRWSSVRSVLSSHTQYSTIDSRPAADDRPCKYGVVEAFS